MRSGLLRHMVLLWVCTTCGKVRFLTSCGNTEDISFYYSLEDSDVDTAKDGTCSNIVPKELEGLLLNEEESELPFSTTAAFCFKCECCLSQEDNYNIKG